MFSAFRLRTLVSATILASVMALAPFAVARAENPDDWSRHHGWSQGRHGNGHWGGGWRGNGNWGNWGAGKWQGEDWDDVYGGSYFYFGGPSYYAPPPVYVEPPPPVYAYPPPPAYYPPPPVYYGPPPSLSFGLSVPFN